MALKAGVGREPPIALHYMKVSFLEGMHNICKFSDTAPGSSKPAGIELYFNGNGVN